MSVLVLTLHCVSGDFNRLEKKRASINVVILDCCREFMFAPSPTRGGERKRLNSGGTCFNRLKRLNSPGTCVYGSITAFPCGPNDTVSDNGRRPLIQPKYRNANNTTFILRIHSSQWDMLLEPDKISHIYFNHIMLPGFYTRFLVHHLTDPELEIKAMFLLVAEKVFIQSQQKQRPVSIFVTAAP